MASPEDDISEGSILRELVLNQYQAIVAGGAALASVLTLNPVPFLLWLGSELVLLPILDSGPLRRLVARRRREAARLQQSQRRAAAIASFEPPFAKRYAAMEQLCRAIESNYQGLSGISQAYLSEQRGKLDNILDGCLNRMLALQRYDKMPITRNPAEIKREISDLEKELAGTDLNDRARAALQKNLELKQRLLKSYSEAGGNMKALETELDSMQSLLEVLHQNSLSLRDPQAISDELDTIVRQSDASDRAVRELEAMLRAGGGEWAPDFDDIVPPAPQPGGTTPASRQKVKGR
jgi:DNA repair exonuclease SbcCD ATPase subunit